MTIRSIVLALVACQSLHAQGGAGPLQPPGPPQDGTYRTLGEIWDKLEQLEVQNNALANQNSMMATRLDALQSRLDAVPLDTTQLLLKNLEQPFPWQDALVSGNEFDGLINSLAFSPAGDPGIAFWQGADGGLGFAFRAEGVWQVETVDATPEAGSFPSLAFTPDGRPAIAYFINDSDPANQELRYAIKVGGIWQSEVVPALQGGSGQLRIGSDGHPRIGFEGTTPGGDAGVILATHDGSAWTFERAAVLDGTTFGNLDMELFADDRAAFAFTDLTDIFAGPSLLKSAVFDGTSWQAGQINPTGTNATQVRLAMAPGDRPIVAFKVQESQAPVRYGIYQADNEGGFFWQTEIAIAAMDLTFGIYFDLSTDRDGNPVIAYAGNQAVSLATRGVYDWTSGQVMEGTFNRLSFAHSPVGQPAFSFHDEADDKLHFIMRELIDTP